MSDDRKVHYGGNLDELAQLAASTTQPLTALLDRDPMEWRSALSQRYGVLDEVLDGRRRAVIYPAARIGRHAAARLTAMGAHVLAFGDRDPRLQGSFLDGLPVLSPDDVAAHHRDDAILVASTLFDSVICEDLRSRGCSAVVPIGYLNLRLPEVFTSREYRGASSAVADPANRSAIERAYGLLADPESRRVFAGKIAFYLSLDKQVLDAIRSAVLPATLFGDDPAGLAGDVTAALDGDATA